MEDLKIKGIADCFENREKPIVIFCDWGDALKIQIDIENKTQKGFSAIFKDEEFKSNLNILSFFYEGKQMIFVDETQMIPFLELIKNR